MKNKKGITLIALIITIIVLLILAGVSISIIVGDNGVIKQAQTAKDKTDLANAQTALETAVATLQTEYMVKLTDDANAEISEIFTFKKLNEELEKLNYQLANGENGTDSIFGINSLCGTTYKTQIKSLNSSDKNLYNVSIRKKNRKAVEISSLPELANGNRPSELLRNTVKLANIGDNYDYSVTVGGVTIDEWKVFWVDEVNNDFFIITSDYLPNEALNSNKAGDGTIKSKTNLVANKFYNVYWNTVPNFKGINSEFTSKYHIDYNLSNNETKVNSKCVSTLLNSDIWSDFVDVTQGGNYAVGTPTLEMWIKSWNEKTKKHDNKVELSYYGNNTNGYKIKISKGCDNIVVDEDASYDYNVASDYMKKTDEYNNSENTLYYPHKIGGKYQNCSGYWISSPSDYESNYIWYVYNGGGVSGRNTNTNPDYALRPIVCMK